MPKQNFLKFENESCQFLFRPTYPEYPIPTNSPIPHGRKYRSADVGEEVLLEAGNEALRRAVPRVAVDLNRAELIGELDHGGWVVSK